MAGRRPLIAGNWKMNGLRSSGVALAEKLAENIKARTAVNFDMLVCPPATLVSEIARTVDGSGIDVGGQDCHTAVSGAHTGDTSAEMLADSGARFVILGHSERRADHGESDKLVHEKALAARDKNLIAVICIGETEAERDSGVTLDVCRKQLADSVPNDATAANVVIAYEPVWAIGTGKVPTNDDIAEVHAAIREALKGKIGAEADKMRILYGGSLKPNNAKEILALEDVDGGLIGGASLQAEDFLAIADSCPA